MTQFRGRKTSKGISFPVEEKRTKQSTVSTSVATMMAKYARTNDLAPISAQLAMYGDFSEVGDFQTAMNQVMAAKKLFLDLPSDVRSMVENNPAKFIDWIGKEENWQKAIDLKLLDPPRGDDPIPVVRVLQEPEPDAG